MDFSAIATEQAGVDRERDERRQRESTARDAWTSYDEAWKRLAGLFSTKSTSPAGIAADTRRETTKRGLAKAESDFRAVAKHLAVVGLIKYLPGVTDRAGCLCPAYRLAELAVCESLRLAADGKPTKGAIADGLARLPGSLTAHWRPAVENVRFALNAHGSNVETRAPGEVSAEAAKPTAGPAELTAPATLAGDRGVSLRDVAEQIRPGDSDGQDELVRRWRNSRAPKLPDPIGKCPNHQQRNLYRPTAIVEFLKKTEGEQIDADFHLKALFSRVSRKPR